MPSEAAKKAAAEPVFRQTVSCFIPFTREKEKGKGGGVGAWRFFFSYDFVRFTSHSMSKETHQRENEVIRCGTTVNRLR